MNDASLDVDQTNYILLVSTEYDIDDIEVMVSSNNSSTAQDPSCNIHNVDYVKQNEALVDNAREVNDTRRKKVITKRQSRHMKEQAHLHKYGWSKTNARQFGKFIHTHVSGTRCTSLKKVKQWNQEFKRASLTFRLALNMSS